MSSILDRRLEWLSLLKELDDMGAERKNLIDQEIKRSEAMKDVSKPFIIHLNCFAIL
jgi:hypothetical protein